MSWTQASILRRPEAREAMENGLRTPTSLPRFRHGPLNAPVLNAHVPVASFHHSSCSRLILTAILAVILTGTVAQVRPTVSKAKEWR